MKKLRIVKGYDGSGFYIKKLPNCILIVSNPVSNPFEYAYELGKEIDKLCRKISDPKVQVIFDLTPFMKRKVIFSLVYDKKRKTLDMNSKKELTEKEISLLGNYSMNSLKEKFRKIVEETVKELISCEVFKDVAKDNLNSDRGREEELYPYFNEILRKKLLESNFEILGIGYGRIKCINKKVDCLVYLKVNSIIKTFAIEIKGPSHDSSWIEKEVDKDIKKLKDLKDKGKLEYGIAVGIILEKTNSQTNNKEGKTICDIEISSERNGIKVKEVFKYTHDDFA